MRIVVEEEWPGEFTERGEEAVASAVEKLRKGGLRFLAHGHGVKGFGSLAIKQINDDLVKAYEIRVALMMKDLTQALERMVERKPPLHG